MVFCNLFFGLSSLKAGGTKSGGFGTVGGKKECGGPDKFCPTGDAHNPKPVSPGHYGAIAIVTGNARTYTTQKQCNPGYTCDLGIMILTIPGRYSQVGKQASQVVNCDPGYFCDYGSVSKNGETVHTQRLVLTGFWAYSSTQGQFSHDDWPRGVEIKGGARITISGFNDGRLNRAFTILANPKPTRNMFWVEFSTAARAANQGSCGRCKGIHTSYSPACIHYGPDGKAATNEWVESPMGKFFQSLRFYCDVVIPLLLLLLNNKTNCVLLCVCS